MFTHSVPGYAVNKKSQLSAYIVIVRFYHKFSSCSLRSIRAVLLAKSGRCFTEPEESFCGNLRVEGKEECDAGSLGSEDSDSCCDKFCHLRRNQSVVCSDKNSPCCKNCKLMPSGQKCREAQRATCEQEAKCSGNNAHQFLLNVRQTTYIVLFILNHQVIVQSVQLQHHNRTEPNAQRRASAVTEHVCHSAKRETINRACATLSQTPVKDVAVPVTRVFPLNRTISFQTEHRAYMAFAIA